MKNVRGNVVKNAWLKHFNNAHEGESFANAWANGDAEVIAFFWTALELISKYEQREIVPGLIRISPRILIRLTSKNERGLITLLTKFTTYFHPTVMVTWSKLASNPCNNYLQNWVQTEYKVTNEFDDGFVYIFALNWLELQERRGGKKEAKLEQSDSKTPTEERREKREERREKKDTDTELTERGLPTGKPLGSAIWDSYSKAFSDRYGVNPVRNAKTNSLCKQLGDRLGEDAHEVIRFYLAHNDTWYVKRQHDLASLLSGAESMHSQWQRGHAVTSTSARNQERTQNAFNAFAKHLDPKSEAKP